MTVIKTQTLTVKQALKYMNVALVVEKTKQIRRLNGQNVVNAEDGGIVYAQIFPKLTQTNQTLDITRLRYWDTKKPMPVVKFEFECLEDLDKAIKTEIIILAEGKKDIVLERKRNSKIVRCFNCNRFGHRASSCKSQRRYYNCGSEDCADSNCTKTSKCSNCEGKHKVSSSNCPVFKKLKNQRQINRILQTSSSDSQNENSFH